jgi:hypothetical protein
MKVGPKRRVEPAKLYTYAQHLYWDFRTLAEGNIRWGFDRERYKQIVEEIESQPLPADDYDRKLHSLQVEKEIRTGRLEAARREERLQQLERAELAKRLPWLRSFAKDDAEKEIGIPGEPDVLRALLDARTAKRIRRICEDAYVYVKKEVEPGVIREFKVRNWPIDPGSPLPSFLSRYAEQFVAAKKDPRFPRSSRSSTLLKQVWFLSRALAGAHFREKPRTAVNLIGSMRPEQMFEESSAAKPKRKRTRQKDTA